MKNDEIKLEDGNYVIPKEKLNTFFKVMTAYMGALNCFPAGEVQKVIKEKMEENGVSDKDLSEFLVVVLDLLKEELTNQ